MNIETEYIHNEVLKNSIDDIIFEKNNKVYHQVYATVPLVGSKISRLYEHLTTGMPVLLMSADLWSCDEEENIERRRELVRILQRNNLNYLQLAGAWQDKGREIDYECSYMIIGYDRFEDYIWKYEELRELAYNLWKKFDQTSVIVGYYNNQTKKYDFEMLTYEIDEETNERLYEKIVDFDNIMFGTAEDIENFHRKVVQYERKNNPEYKDKGFGYTKGKRKHKVGFALTTKKENDFKNSEEYHLMANLFIPTRYMSSNGLYSLKK